MVPRFSSVRRIIFRRREAAVVLRKVYFLIAVNIFAVSCVCRTAENVRMNRISEEVVQ